MATSPAPQFDPAAIRSLVEEVLRRLAAEGHPAAAASTSPQAAPSGGVVIHDAVVTLAHLERLPPGTRQVRVAARAVVTPSARDRAREAGVAIHREALTGQSGAPANRLVVIATADCRGDAATRAAAIARLVPHAQRLPATGLPDVLSALALHASRDAARGVLLTSRPAAAVVLANRSTSLRAVTARDAAAVTAAAAECAANLLVVDPARFAGGLERACADFATRASGPVPSDLTPPAAGCSCQAHSH